MRIEKVWPSVIARFLNRPVEIQHQDEEVSQAKTAGSDVEERATPAPRSSDDFFAEEIAKFGGGKVFEQYMEGKKK